MMQNPYAKPQTSFPYGAMPMHAGMAQYPSATPPGWPSGMMMPSTMPVTPGTTPADTGGVNVPGLLPIESSYIENILRLNLNKTVTIYMTFENNSEWNAKVFRGVLEAAGRDHIIISDPKTGMRYLLLMVNLDYITFEGEMQYTYPY